MSILTKQEKLIIFHAGSLNKPFTEIEKQFSILFPHIQIIRESGGSNTLIQSIIKGKSADIMVSADFEIINKNLIPNFATYNICFAQNKIVLCYTEKSRYQQKINKHNWYKILLKPDVTWAHTNPDYDPCGYRSLMVMQLAEQFYSQPRLYSQLIQNPNRYIYPTSKELLNVLSNNTIDYIWEYQSVAKQNNFHYINFDDQINLSNFHYNSSYKNAIVTITNSSDKTSIQTGKAIIYGITAIKNSPHYQSAITFLEFLLSPQYGMKILQEQEQPILSPAFVTTKEEFQALPLSLKSLVTFI